MFNGIWLVASEPLTIQGREVAAGEQFHISRVHSGALLVTGRATIVHPQPPPKSRVAAPPPEPPAAPRRRRRQQKTDDVVETHDETPALPAVMPETIPETTAQTDDAEAVDVPRRRYQRRDLEADE
jgi:hypothetical protein